MSIMHPVTPEEIELMRCYGLTQGFQWFLLIFGWVMGLVTGVVGVLNWQNDHKEKDGHRME